MGKQSFRCKIKDWRDIHNGFWLNLRPGYTALVGPNGAGKTTLLHQIREIAFSKGYKVFSYSNKTQEFMDRYLAAGDVKELAKAVIASEGEKTVLNFEATTGKIGKAVREAIEQEQPLFILLDNLDSGTSIDRQRELMRFFEMIEQDVGVQPGKAEHEVYILAAVNAYEMAKGICVDVRTGKTMTFGSYEEYANFVSNYFSNKAITNQ